MEPVVNNSSEQQFEIETDGSKAYLTYRFYKQSIAFMHTFVPEQLKGQGIASMLATAAFAHAKEMKKQVMVYCPFVASFIKKHPEYEAQLDPAYHNKRQPAADVFSKTKNANQ
ncbi:GNAT family N-acetyltransferase [Danxiaibacter flavus]|uniref:GNAT family N-acetyltransferase n=1 Tax=Danxiaibacter flavus TaxID=3049108 RepID=A0ABV3ZN60_9BACT|nr:GNAT family N-acetyltransferase [Chitinophagaceae bacterium DXS]